MSPRPQKATKKSLYVGELTKVERDVVKVSLGGPFHPLAHPRLLLGHPPPLFTLSHPIFRDPVLLVGPFGRAHANVGPRRLEFPAEEIALVLCPRVGEGLVKVGAAQGIALGCVEPVGKVAVGDHVWQVHRRFQHGAAFEEATEKAVSACGLAAISRIRIELTEEEEAEARRRSRRGNRLEDIRTRLEGGEDGDPDSRPKRTCHLCMVLNVSPCWKFNARDRNCGLALVQRRWWPVVIVVRRSVSASASTRGSAPSSRRDGPPALAHCTARETYQSASSLWSGRYAGREGDHALSSGLSG